jgi:hypothetical protein
VSLTAGDAHVQQALSGSSPELQRLLERVGATDTTITVQGQPMSAGLSGQLGQSGQPGQPGQGGQSSQAGQFGQPGQPGQSGRSGYQPGSGQEPTQQAEGRASPASSGRRTPESGRLDRTL